MRCLMSNDVSVFISYSWDSSDHQNWVKNLVGKLTRSGFDAKMDTLQTEKDTVHLGEMMASSIRENDYTIVVMTPEYSDRADNYRGGVGTETRYIMNLLDENRNRVIPIIRQGDDSTAIPFYLTQINYVDFRNDSAYEGSYQSLLMRMQHNHTSNKVKAITAKRAGNSLSDIGKTESPLIPNLRKITELDKNQFLRKNFNYLKKELSNLLKATKESNANFDYVIDDVNTRKVIIELYIDGSLRTSYKLWVDNKLSQSDAIYISYGRWYTNSDSSFNDMIQVTEVDNELMLTRMMTFMGTRDPQTKEDILKGLWEEMITQVSS